MSERVVRTLAVAGLMTFACDETSWAQLRSGGSLAPISFSAITINGASVNIVNGPGVGTISVSGSLTTSAPVQLSPGTIRFTNVTLATTDTRTNNPKSKFPSTPTFAVVANPAPAKPTPIPDRALTVAAPAIASVRDGGLTGLVGPGSGSGGVINAALERVPVGGTLALTVDLAGDGLIALQVARPIIDAHGQAPSSDTRTVALTASTARDIVNGVVNAPTRLGARTVSSEGGVVVFGGN